MYFFSTEMNIKINDVFLDIINKRTKGKTNII